jgi:predicted nucleotidyltransferase
MAVRSIPPSFDPDIVDRIDKRLVRIEDDHGVRLPLAIESGSRAWGFPSPDSDFDCRFIFVRGEEDYLSLQPKPDVIELPLEGELDVNGWDLAKALKLMLKGNAVVLEWLRSPIAYRCDPSFRDCFLALARDCADRRLIGATIFISASGSGAPISVTARASRSRKCSTRCAQQLRCAG